ncbi:MAG TPA: hypothetical protein VIH35_01250 [Kiritimatiellia bacterium]|jgi:hypothetical protein
MKKLAAVCAVALAGLAATAQAQTLTLAYPITVSVASDPINLSGITDPVSFGIVGFNTTNLSNYTGGQPRSTVQNNGYATVDYTARAAVSGGWTIGTAPGANVATFYGIFTQALTSNDNPTAGRNVAAADFAVEDRLNSNTAIRASTTNLARNAETAAETNGKDVFTTQSIRSMRYRLDSPTSGSTAAQTITVTIGAIAL